MSEDTVRIMRPEKPVLRDPDLDNLVGQETGRHRLSHTRLSVFLACHRKYSLDYLERLEPIRRKRSLSLGSAFQKGVELQDPEAGVRSLNGWELCETCRGAGALAPDLNTGEMIPLWGDVGLASWHCEACEGEGWLPPAEPLRFWDQHAEDQHRVNEVIVRSSVKLYLATWPTPDAEQREFEYLVRLRSPWTGRYSNTFDLHGFADGLSPLDFNDAGWRLVENKLVGKVDSIMVQRLPLDRQLALERYAIWRVTGRPVLQAQYRWIKKPSIKQRGGRKQDKSDAESLEQFLERLAGDYEVRPEFYTVEEEPKWTTVEDLLRIECELWEWAEDVRAKLRPVNGRARIFDRNTSHCSEYGGCQYLPICTGDPDAMSLYRVRPPRVSTLQETAPEADE